MIAGSCTCESLIPSPMPDKQSPPQPPLFALPEHAVIALAGRDALAFAQAQVMNDIAALGDGAWQWNGWLNPKGRVLALFALLRRDAETVWLVTHGADAAALVEGLRRFVFRSKVGIEVRADLHVAGAFVPPGHARGNLSHAGDAGVELDLGGDGGARALWMRPTAAAVDARNAARWRAFDIDHGLPWPAPALLPTWTPQQLSLDRLGAYSVRKGCYPGQEIVARTHFLGQAKRCLVRVQSTAPLAAGTEVLRDGRALGTIASTSADGLAALAVLPVEDDHAGLATAAGALEARPLLGGLAR
jgi:tRNA-modifying protein YgfZ